MLHPSTTLTPKVADSSGPAPRGVRARPSWSKMSEATMRRTAIAAAWIAGTTVPLLAAVVFLFGCCVLPFHAYIHKAMPMCHMAMGILSGEHADHHDGAQQPLPARARQEPVKRIATEIPRSFQLAPL